MTEPLTAREALSRFGFDSLFRGYTDPTFAMDVAGTIIDCNSGLLSKLDLVEAAVIGAPYATLFSERTAVDAQSEFVRATAGEPGRFESELARSDGSVVRAVVTLFPVENDGKVAGIMGFARDIAAQDDTEVIAARGQALERMAGRLALMGAWTIELSTNTLHWSDELCQILGFPPGKHPTLEEAFALHPDEDRIAFERVVDRAAVDGTPFDERRSMYTATGRLLRIRALGEAIRDRSGDIVRVQGALYDITDQVDAMAQKLDTEERLSAMVDAITDGIAILDTDWAYSYVNPRAEEILGEAAHNLVGHSMWDVLPDWRGTEFAIAFKSAELERTTITVRDYYEPLGLWLDVRVYPLTTGLAIYFRDVSEEELAREKSAADEKRIIAQAALLDVARDAIVVRGLDHTIRYWNRAASELYGWSSDEVIGSSIRDLVYLDVEAFDSAQAATMRDGAWNGETEQITRSGERIIVDCSWTLVNDDEGNPDSIFAVNTDITARRSQEERVLRAQRMESLGTLAGGVAHDLNNVLTPILMSVQMLALGENDPGRSELLGVMEASVKRGAEMIRQVLSFARGVEGRRIEVDLNELLIELESECNEALADNVAFTLKADDKLWRTNGDPTQLLQVLINLVYNARDAMPDGGGLVVGARNVTIDQSFSSLTHLASPGDYILLTVEDTGTGMTPDVMDKIFEPFFTTKDLGQGTGLGLATSAAILRSHEGFIQVYSEPGTGTRFSIHLPASTEPDGESEIDHSADVTEELPRGNGELVLIVDDESAIRQITRTALEAFGYVTVVASNGNEAIEFCDASPGSVDLVVTDMMMPLMDGAALASRLHSEHPAMPIVAMSGLNTNGGIVRAADSGVHNFLAKPFTTGELLRVVRSALDGRSQH